MACGSCKTCAARCSNHLVSCGHALSQRPSPTISKKPSEPLHNLIMKSEPALADLHRIPDATGDSHPTGSIRKARWREPAVRDRHAIAGAPASDQGYGAVKRIAPKEEQAAGRGI